MKYYAHKKEGKPPAECKPLEDHLRWAAETARAFASVFSTGDRHTMGRGSKMTELYAHTPNDKGEWHSLYKHLKDVGDLSQGFADKFRVGNLAYRIGLWHDLGGVINGFLR
ncbi:MAG: hypothetical protein ABFD50_03155 [Smithella sp.]